ncbi:MAG: porphobilinogen synthase, partial [Thermonemataceae bacterium]|nr:porphobilinogen synthase [Thermonemataceae bacterium]
MLLPIRRPRRNRKNEVIRNLVQENWLSKNDFIFPLFFAEGQNKKVEISSMPGIYRFSLDLLLEEISECIQLGIKAFAPFPQIEENLKNSYGTESYNEDGLYLRAIQEIKKNFPEAMLFTDVALDPYSSDGHDGIVRNGEILNDETLEALGKMALAQAKAGTDCIAPSDMMDG